MNPSNCARWSAWLVPLMVLGGCTSAKGSAVDAKGSAPDATPATDVAQVCESFDPCMDASVVDGQCSISVAPDGQACSSATGPCAATCQGGVCVQPVCMASGGPCYEAIGQCTSSGECQSVPKPAGTSCTASVGPGACKTSAGTCDGNGFCNAAPAAPGAPCTLAASAIGANNCLDYFKAVCDENGACHATVKEGSPCDFGCGYDANAGVCDATGKCKPDPAAGPVKCSISMVINGPNNAMKTVYDQNPCLEGHCGDDGSCQPVALLGKACTPVDLDGSQCQNNFTCDAKGFCSGPVAPGQACNPHAGPCYPGGLCAADGSCTPIPAPGKACVTDDPCRPSGTCNATGECIAPVAVGAICGAAPGACWQKTCQSDGSCKQVANPGAACTVDMNPCKPGTCQSDGSCTAAIKVGAPCPTGDPCTTGTCDSAGTCAATVQTGKSCWTGSGDGACLDDGICQAPCKAGATCKGACSSCLS